MHRICPRHKARSQWWLAAVLAVVSVASANKIKHCRRVATRYDKLAANYLAFV